MNRCIAIITAVVFCLAGSMGLAQAQEKIPVVATFSILADMTARVGGDRISVHTLVGPQQDAHVFQPSPDAAAAVAKARAVITNGLGFEGWIDRLISSSGFKGPVIVASTGINPLKTADGEHVYTDPHAWQDMANAVVYVGNIKQGLCVIDAGGCEIYARNATAYSSEIMAAHEDINRAMAALPAEKRKVITSHDAFSYFAKAYGVTFMAPAGISTDSEASAKDVARLINQIRSQKVTALFVESISDTRLIEQIARETNVKPGATLYSDALSPADGPAGTYLDMMRHNARELSAAMAVP